ncbi:hypothetical protein [Pedobacter sp. SYSU D00535]|uniref:hypothetical protein n=1 Tax=Pedobacter sp. SYSU D00535 TaxID=2810308 RepID=UPI001A970514|nr:hypothetical protein [Pedobacter sp. SYSU D00535]
MIKKKSIRILLSSLLLLCFSAVAIPFDLFHHHTEEAVSCSDSSQGVCSHKAHLSKKASSCWLCAFHIDKNFTTVTKSDHAEEPILVRILTENRVAGFFFDRLISYLRGPPAH